MERLFEDNGDYTVVASDLSTKIERAALVFMREYAKAGYQHREISHIAMLAILDASLTIALEKEGQLKYE